MLRQALAQMLANRKAQAKKKQATILQVCCKAHAAACNALMHMAGTAAGQSTSWPSCFNIGDKLGVQLVLLNIDPSSSNCLQMA